jgi:hypothetical protein
MPIRVGSHHLYWVEPRDPLLNAAESRAAELELSFPS